MPNNLNSISEKCVLVNTLLKYQKFLIFSQSEVDNQDQTKH